MPPARLVLPIIFGLFCAACAAGSGFHASKGAGTYTLASQQPVDVRANAGQPDANTKELQKNKPSQSTGSRTGVNKKTNQLGAHERQTASREAGGQTAELSLVVKKDDSDDDLSSLFTDDYAHQFDIPIVFNDAVQYFVRYFTTEKRQVMATWLKRSRRYVPMIQEILREQGLPEDLIYLAMIESGFNPKAYSSMKACGPWQFIYETGGRYGLRVNHWVDERRDPEKSTVAAALYLKDLFNQFGNWYLAAAGYNAGEKRIEKEVEQHETSDFWELTKYNTLPRETREYIPRLLAAAIIAKEPEKFGFANIDYDQPVRFINARVPGATALTLLARAAAIDSATLRSLNPELLTGITPPDVDDYSIKLPEWVDKAKFKETVKNALAGEERLEQIVTYTCKKRDTVAAVMKLHKVTYNDLMLVNSYGQTLSAKQGSLIYIPKYAVQSDPAEGSMVVADREAVPVPEAKHDALPVVEAGLAVQTMKKTRAASRGSADSRKDAQVNPNVRILLTSSQAAKTGRHVQTAVYHTSRKGKTLVAVSTQYYRSFRSVKEKGRAKKNGKVRLTHQGTKAKAKSRKAIRVARG